MKIFHWCNTSSLRRIPWRIQRVEQYVFLYLFSTRRTKHITICIQLLPDKRIRQNMATQPARNVCSRYFKRVLNIWPYKYKWKLELYWIGNNIIKFNLPIAILESCQQNDFRTEHTTSLLQMKYTSINMQYHPHNPLPNLQG